MVLEAELEPIRQAAQACPEHNQRLGKLQDLGTRSTAGPCSGPDGTGHRDLQAL